MDDTVPLRSRALRFLRQLRDWTRPELAAAAKVTRSAIAQWERGEREPSWSRLRKLAQVMGHPESTLRDVVRLLSPPEVPTERWVGPVYFSAEQEQALADFGAASGKLLGFSLCQGVVRAHIEKMVQQEREEARALWDMLVAERSLRTAVRKKREYQTWAVAELLCDESIRAAAHAPQRALELAEAAVVVSKLAPGEEKWRLRVQGYAHAHVGNAWRVIGRLQVSDQAFMRYDEKWKASEGGDPGRLLNESRVLGLEASLRREQDRLADALALIEAGLALGNARERIYLLINKAKTLEAAEEYEDAIEVLRKADSDMAESELRLAFIVRFDLLVSLCNLERFSEVQALFPEVRRLSIQSGKTLDRIRVRWLEGILAAGTGNLERGVELLSVVKEEFVEQNMTYDAALASMDLATVLLRLQRTEQVKALARRLTPIFSSEGIPQKSLGALLLFREAAEAEVATVELVQSIRDYLRRAQGRPDLEFNRRR